MQFPLHLPCASMWLSLRTSMGSSLRLPRWWLVFRERIESLGSSRNM